MCEPALSFLIDKTGKIYYQDNIFSHTALAKSYDLDEDKAVKVGYDWTTKTLDILGENDSDKGLPFELKASHYRAIDAFVNKKVGTQSKLLAWLKKNNKLENYYLTNALSVEGTNHKVNKKTFPKLFKQYPNIHWRGKDGKRNIS